MIRGSRMLGTRESENRLRRSRSKVPTGSCATLLPLRNGCGHGPSSSWVPENPVGDSVEIQVTISSDHALQKSVLLPDPGLGESVFRSSPGAVRLVPDFGPVPAHIGAVASVTSEVTQVVVASSFSGNGGHHFGNGEKQVKNASGGRRHIRYSEDASGKASETGQTTETLAFFKPDTLAVLDRGSLPTAFTPCGEQGAFGLDEAGMDRISEILFEAAGRNAPSLLTWVNGGCCFVKKIGDGEGGRSEIDGKICGEPSLPFVGRDVPCLDAIRFPGVEDMDL